jgi:putative exporter of polyketide antibiotics
LAQRKSAPLALAVIRSVSDVDSRAIAWVTPYSYSMPDL